MKIKGKEIAVDDVLGTPQGETEFTFLFVPLQTYKIIVDQAAKEGISVSGVFERALTRYIGSFNNGEQNQTVKQDKQSSISPDIVVRRRK